MIRKSLHIQWTPPGALCASNVLLPTQVAESTTLYNEAFFCTCCGIIWCRRIWEGEDCSWWLSLRSHWLSPFTFYDFPEALASNSPELLETLVTEFLNDPTICGYTGEWTRVHPRPSNPPDGSTG